MSILLTLQQSLEEPLGSVGIAPGLDEDIEHNAILIDGAPEILQHALDPNEHLVRVPLVSWSWPAASPAIGESRACTSVAPSRRRRRCRAQPGSALHRAKSPNENSPNSGHKGRGLFVPYANVANLVLADADRLNQGANPHGR
jgi:hypothetical protein